MEHAAKRNGHRRDEEGRGDGVDHRCADGSDDGEQHQKFTRRAFGHFHSPQSENAEEAGLLDYRNQDHHTCQKADGIEIDEFLNRLVLGDEAEVHHGTAAKQGADGAGDLL